MWSRFNEAGAINPGKLDQIDSLNEWPQGASMRPGQLTPENADSARGRRRAGAGFNEAGAINPGKQRPTARDTCSPPCFNEAGAINPGKPASSGSPSTNQDSFNEAGAINPGKQRGGGAAVGMSLASMRPGQLTPENAAMKFLAPSGSWLQ